MDIDQEVFALEVGPGQVEEEGAKGEIDFGMVGSIETIDEFPIILYLLLVLVVPLPILRIGLDDLLADDLRFIHQVKKVILPVCLGILRK